jgi:hypothetical protein
MCVGVRCGADEAPAVRPNPRARPASASPPVMLMIFFMLLSLFVGVE